MSEPRALINVEQAITKYKLARRTLYAWMRSGDVEWCRKPHVFGRWMFVDSLEKRVARKFKHRTRPLERREANRLMARIAAGAADWIILQVIREGHRTLPTIAQAAKVELAAARDALSRQRRLGNVRMYGDRRGAYYTFINRRKRR